MPKRDEQLYYVFEPEGCYCKVERQYVPFTNGEIIFRCKKCKEKYEYAEQANPDFSTPDGFFWLIERAKKADWWGDFIWQTSTGDKGCKIFIIDILTSPTALFNALCEYHGIEGE